MSAPSLAAAADAALEAFDRLRPAEAEIYLEQSAVEEVAVADGRVERVDRRTMRGAGLRVIQDGRIGFSHTSDLTADGVAAAAARAADAARHASPDGAHVLPSPDAPPDVEGNADPAVETTTAERRIDLARRIEAAARAADPRVRRTREASYQDVAGEVLLARGGGHRYGHRFTRAYGYVDLVAEQDGDAQSGTHLEFAIGPDGLDPEAIGRQAARRATDKIGGRPCATGRLPLLLAPEVIDGLLEALASIFYAEEARKGKSFLAGRRGEVVAGARLTLVDDGRLPGGCGAAPVDGEGVATRSVTLIEAGVLRGFLHTGFSARRMGEPPTGNASRDSYRSVPTTSNNGLVLRPTGERLADLLAGVSEALRIDEVMGLHTIDPISGDFSLGAAGRAVRRGEVAEAVAGIAIAGNVRDLLASVTAVADDRRLMPSGNAVATVLLEGLSVGGS